MVKVVKNVSVVCGAKWGDEGKGKVASLLAKDADIVIRATGGNNAGHTVIYNGKKLPLHLVPGGIAYPQTTAIIGPGVFVDPVILISEIKMLEELGIPDIDSRLKISGRAHVIFPYHKSMDELQEALKKNPVGTTKRGIGPAVEDKARRVGIRMYDLLLDVEKLKEKIEEAIILYNYNFKYVNMLSSVVDAAELAEEYSLYGKELKKYIVDVFPIISDAISDEEKKIVIEGAQAFKLDPDYGDYPMNTSASCIPAASIAGAGVPVTALKEIILVDKAYNSRVGNGPFPTEEPSSVSESKDDVPRNGPLVGDVIREFGNEFGTTTNRPRRCGWIDIPILYTAAKSVGADYLCINHLDTLGKIGMCLGYIKICIGYKYRGKVIPYYPDDTDLTGEIPKPIYLSIEGGWEIDSSCKDYESLPNLAKSFIRMVEYGADIPVKYIGIGPENEDIIIR